MKKNSSIKFFKSVNMMKFKFNPSLDYQKQAVDSVTNIFRGQSSVKSLFSFNGIYRTYDLLKGVEDNISNRSSGVGNRLELTGDDLLENVRRVQDFHRLAPTSVLSRDSLNFTVEMETGTGKTYVYLKTIFELNKLYGFTKFIIVVPSIAIKEGVYKTLQITEDHFKSLYDNVLYDYFIYDSGRLEDIRNFALDSHIKIMVINIDAFRKSFSDTSKETKANIIHRPNDRLNGYKPIDLISQTNPVVIVDEPQSSANTSKSKEAIKSLNPLCTLQYSATPPKDSENLIYKLDAIDAYEMNLVKQIEVDSIVSSDNHNDAYLKLLSVDNKHSPITADIEMDVNVKGSIKRKKIKVKQSDDLSDLKLTNRSMYDGYIVDEIYCEDNNEYVSFTNGEKIYLGNATGEISKKAISRQLIYMTIKEHLDKELKLKDKGIKVLSLFFIDKVANYRQYDKDGNTLKGEYAKIFDEEYTKLIKKDKYKELRYDKRFSHDLDKIHNGYFSVDKKGHFKDSKATGKEKIAKSKADDDTYSLIMKDKEKLLSFSSPLRFIFSHSALREGWDNPNVFQICTLNETQSTMKKRQEIGRGLRLCVNQDGERIKDRSINILTIMANESYEKFARDLQTEMEKDEGFKFGVIDRYFFANIKHKNRKGEIVPIEKSGSQQIFNFFKKEKYIDGKGKIQQRLKEALHDNTLNLPEQYKDIKQEITEKLIKPASDYKPRNKNDRKEIKLNKKVYLDDNFKQLWDKIKYKTTYRVDFDTDELIRHCSHALEDELDVKNPRFIYTKSGLQIDASGVKSQEKLQREIKAEKYEIDLPDIIQYLQQETFLTRKTIIQILIKSNTLELFKKNPQEYMEKSLKIIKRQLNHILVDGIKYTKNGEYYAQELFEDNELYGYLTKNMIESQKSVYNYVVYDSQNECNFEKQLEKDNDILLYTKLPSWFKIPTPIGTYNPDWAILVNDEEEEEKLYFVVETKANIDEDALRPTESYKIKCAKRHFKAIGENVTFEKVDNYKKFKEDVYID